MKSMLYIVGAMIDENAGRWELHGVFSTEERARAAATEKNHFICMIPLDHTAPVCTTEWPDEWWLGYPDEEVEG